MSFLKGLFRRCRKIDNRAEPRCKEKQIEFEDIRGELLEKIRKTEKSNIKEQVSLLDGVFAMYHIDSASVLDFSPTEVIPMIVLVGDESNRLYFFAAKRFFPDL